ncbi:MAG: sigma-54-dependent Fis family transcriptional regulator [Deltaproteobacteria bacterium]|nr:sigma-54-dependent Fis family transcriptional regulator [Deltaproteobacteria bacterium]
MDASGKRILIVEDDPGLRFTMTDTLEDAGFAVRGADNGAEAIRLLGSEPFDVVLTDLRLPGRDGLEVLREARTKFPPPSVITMTGYGSIESAVEAMKLGAEDYLTKPFSRDEFLLLLAKVLRVRSLEEENRDLKRRIVSRSLFEELVGKSKAMQDVFDLISLVAETDATVLVLGESGTGKELVARALHRRGKRRDGPFVALNCTAIPESLFEAELFGYEKGAFTGADRRRTGRIEQAHGGTLFLDEIAEMPPSAQAKLLRVLQERSFARIGGGESVHVDIRVVSATNREDLKAMVEEGTFREDLFYRLDVFAIRLPPLRERREDMPLLVEHFLEKLGGACRVSDKAMALLMDHRFPGNVRELWNVMERASILCREGTIGPEHLPPEFPGAEKRLSGNIPAPGEILPLRDAVKRFETDYIQRALQAVGGSRTRASGLLGIGRKALWERLKR